VLLWEGVNDLNTYGQPGIARAIAGLETMTKACLASGAAVLLATETPQRPGGLRASSVELVEPFNAQVRALAAEKGATLVDLYAQIDLSSIGEDGLHASDEGYSRIAGVFFDTIRQKFEESGPTYPSSTHQARSR
jgi:lysophospholipase L1-like esterase